jgi:ribonuclease E
MLFNATYAEELRVAAVQGQRLINFDIETSSKEQRRGNIYKGFITRVEPSLEACFVDYGTGKQGFLPFKEIDYSYLPEVNGQKVREFSKLPLGTELIIQVEKDERGNKGAALTSYITLPGRYLVLMPNNSRAGGISRRIEGEERDELKALMAQLEVPAGMSIILRTAALGRVIEELQWDLTYLLKLWGAVGAAANEQKGAFLIYQESSLVIRSIRDHFTPDIAEILIDTEEVYTQACQFMAHVMPNFADRIKLYRDDVPLFSRFQIEHQIESAYSRAVHLPSGGSIVIDHTEALTAVDVNSARANKGADIETTAFLTNIEAAEEISRQLRLRDLGGLVVVDFIDMENPRNQRELENHFKNQLSLDRARIQMGKLSKFGLLELSRQRLQSSLDESSTISCPRCAGVGSIRGIESSALHVLRIVQEEAVKNPQLSGLHVQLPVDVATYLLNERRDDVASIETRMKVKIVLIPNVHLDSPNYKIKKLAYDGIDMHKSSYNLVELPEETLGYKGGVKKSDVMLSKQPLVQNVSTTEPAPLIDLYKSKSLFSGIVRKISQLFVTKAGVETVPQLSKRPRRSLEQRNLSSRNAESGARANLPVAERKERNNPAPAAAKSRPVQIAKSNPKIQTVRQSTSTAAAKTGIAVRGEKAQERNLERERLPERAERGSNPRQNSGREPRQAQVAAVATTKASVQQPAPQVAVVERGLQRAPAKLNIAEAQAMDQVIFAAGTTGAAVMTVLAAPAVDVDKLPAARTNDLKPIDLGGLELVATKHELLKQNISESLVYEQGKRFSDIVVEEKALEPEIHYQLVETKV